MTGLRAVRLYHLLELCQSVVFGSLTCVRAAHQQSDKGCFVYASLDWDKQINTCLHPSVILASRMRSESDCKGNFTAMVLKHQCLHFMERAYTHLMCSHILSLLLL